MKKEEIKNALIGLIIVCVIISLIGLLVFKKKERSYSCHDDEYFQNGFLEAMKDNNLDIDINSSNFETDYEDAYNAIVDREIITKDDDSISNEQIYISGYLAAIKSFNIESPIIDINFDVDQSEFCDE